MSSTVAGEQLTSTGKYTVLVAVNNPENVTQLMRTAVDLAHVHDGRIHVVSVIHKHHTSPFRLFSDEHIKTEYGGQRDQLVETATTVAADADVPVADSLLVGTSVARAILSAIDEVDADAVLLGWRGERSTADYVLGTTIDPVVRRADCDVLVERVGVTAGTVESILLPTVGGPHADLATEVAGAIASRNDATVHVLSVVAPDANNRQRDAATGHVDRSVRLLPEVVDADREILEAEDIAGALLDAAAEHDLIVLGATRRGVLTRRIAGSIPQTVGADTDKPFVMTKRRPDRSWLDTLLEYWLP